MRKAMKMEQIGSDIFQPNVSINKVDTMTPTLPNVSASTCKNTPESIKGINKIAKCKMKTLANA